MRRGIKQLKKDHLENLPDLNPPADATGNGLIIPAHGAVHVDLRMAFFIGKERGDCRSPGGFVRWAR